jgi:hypothetical protein
LSNPTKSTGFSVTNFPSAGLAESSPSNLEFEGGWVIAAPIVGDDGLDDELLFVVLGHTDEILDHID